MSLFFDEEEAVQELRKMGYKVIKLNYPQFEQITSVKKLLEFFYYKREAGRSDLKVDYYRDAKEDMEMMGQFVKSREKLGLGRKAALQEAALIIDGLFKYEKYLNLTTPIISPKILNVRSFVDRVCGFLNGDDPNVAESETSEYVTLLSEEYARKYQNAEFDSIKDERQKIMERLNVKRQD